MKHASLQAYADDRFAAAYIWEAYIERGPGIMPEFALSQFQPDGTTENPKSLLPPKPFIIYAKPLRDELPEMHIIIEAGVEFIWMHRVRMCTGLDTEKHPKTFQYETLLLGGKMPDGREELFEIHPDGAVVVQSSVAAALADPTIRRQA